MPRMMKSMISGMRPLALAAALVAVLAAAAQAEAAAPVLTRVSYDAETTALSVDWTLPPAAVAHVIEVNADPTLDSDGYFRWGPHDGLFFYPEIVYAPLDANSTSWSETIGSQRPGTYYVHVGTSCYSCATTEWTSLGIFTVPGSSPPPPPPPQATRSKAPKTYMPDCIGKPRFRPAKVLVACDTGNRWLGNVRWSSWSATSATGVGVYHWNDCIPRCNQGHLHARAGARLQLLRMRNCSSKGFRQFTRLRLSPPKSLQTRLKPFIERLSCSYR